MLMPTLSFICDSVSEFFFDSTMRSAFLSLACFRGLTGSFGRATGRAICGERAESARAARRASLEQARANRPRLDWGRETATAPALLGVRAFPDYDLGELAPAPDLLEERRQEVDELLALGHRPL